MQLKVPAYTLSFLLIYKVASNSCRIVQGKVKMCK